jgi:hypothetical protein
MYAAIRRERGGTRTMFGKVGACISDLDKLEAEVRLRIPSPDMCRNVHPFRYRRRGGRLCPWCYAGAQRSSVTD